MLKNLLVVGAGNYAAMAMSLAINGLLTRQLGADRYGHLALLLTASQMLALVAVNWTHTALVRFGAQEFAESGTVSATFWTRIWIATPWICGAAVLMAVARRPIAAYLLIPEWGLLLVLAQFAAAFMLVTVGAVFQARSEMPRYGAMLFLDKALAAAVLIVAVAGGVRLAPLGALGIYAGSSTAVAIWGLTRTGSASLMPMRFDRANYVKMFAFSFPLLFSSWVGVFGTNWFDLLIIKMYRPMSEVGLYSLGAVLAGVVQQVTIIFSTLLLPKLSVMVAGGELEKIRAFIDRVLPYWFLVTGLLFSIVLLFAQPVVPLIFGRAFAPTASVVAVLMVATCALALFNAFSPLVSAFGATWAVTGIALASGIVNVVMDFVLIPSHGIQGAAFATVLAYGTSAVLVLAYVQRRLQHNVFRLALLFAPVLIVCALYLFLEPFQFYLFAAPAAAISVFWLMHHFQLFHGAYGAAAAWNLESLLRRIP
jgi:Membrane protein involved in the export of O-antigen and teichoic acid